MVIYETIFSLTKRFTKQDARRQLVEMTAIVNRHDGVVLSVQDLGWRRTSQRARLKAQDVNWYGRWMAMTYGANPRVVQEMNDAMAKSVYVLRFTTEKVCRNKQSLFLSRIGSPNKASYSLPLKT